jgi:hypothetical protein
VVWHRDDLVAQVAMYVKLLAEQEVPKVTLAADVTAFMRLSSELLLSTAALRSARVRVGDDSPVVRRSGGPESRARERFTVVEGGAG